MSPRRNRILTAAIFAVLWTAGMLWWSTSIDLETVIVTSIAGVIAGVLMYWVFDKFSTRLRV
jgi:hypothetical protein